MKQLIPMDTYGVFADTHDTARVNSLYVAKFFEKEHFHVLRDIAKITDSKSGLSEEFSRLNFEQSKYTDERGKKQPCVEMTRDGFTLLAMGYTGAKAMKFKELYIRRFNEMERFIDTLVTARREFPLLTENIKLLHENPKPYHFSNECDMLNRIVTGMSAKQFREKHGIAKGESIRPFLTAGEIEMLDKLQKADVGLLIAVPDYEQRKRQLEWYYAKLREKALCA